MTSPNKLEGLPLETLSSLVLEFESKARTNPIGGPSFLGKLLVLPANVRLDWKVIARYKHSSLFGLIGCNQEKKFYNIDTLCQKYHWPFFFVVYATKNKLVCSLLEGFFRLV